MLLSSRDETKKLHSRVDYRGGIYHFSFDYLTDYLSKISFTRQRVYPRVIPVKLRIQSSKDQLRSFQAAR